MDKETLTDHVEKIYEVINDMLEDGNNTDLVVSTLIHASIDTLYRASEENAIDPYKIFGQMNYILYHTMDIHNRTIINNQHCDCCKESEDND